MVSLNYDWCLIVGLILFIFFIRRKKRIAESLICSKMYIIMLFDVKNTKAEEDLRLMDIETEDGMLLLSRKITEGRSISRINGEACQ